MASRRIRPQSVFFEMIFRACSSAVEQLAFNQLALGSNPSTPTKLFRVSSAVEQLTVNQLVVGSIPTPGAKHCSHRLTVRTSDFQSGNRSSILLGSTKFALVTELVYVLVLETRFWEFESPLGHQLMEGWQSPAYCTSLEN